MTSSEAIAVLSEYLTATRRIDPSALSAARATVGSQRPIAEHLAALVSIDEAWAACADFEGRAAEFAELTAAQRAAEFPDYAAHLPDCRRCRQLLARIRPIWDPIARGPDLWKQLTNGISIALDAAGAIVDRGFGPPSEEIIGPITAGPTDQTRRHEWRLNDDEAGCIIHLLLEYERAGANLRCSIEPPPFTPARIELRSVPNGSTFYAGPAPGPQDRSIAVPSGDWTLTIISANTLRWFIPLSVHLR
jgi:hypothetical protein